MTRVCNHCEKPFEAENSKKLYCTVKCRRLAAKVRWQAYRAENRPLQTKSEKWKRAVLAPREKALQCAYNQIKRDRNPRFAFNLTLAELVGLIFKPCHYCGSAPSIPTRSGGLLRNGIDRLDSAKDYTPENCAPACWLCNRMKGQLEEKPFLLHVEKICRHRQ